jgi:hypothetical protein
MFTKFCIVALRKDCCLMSESQQRIASLSTAWLGTSVPRDLAEEQSSKFGIVVRALWPIKPALNLAQRAGCSERAANFYITGKRDPSVAALLVIVNEIRGRRRA